MIVRAPKPRRKFGIFAKSIRSCQFRQTVLTLFANTHGFSWDEDEKQAKEIISYIGRYEGFFRFADEFDTIGTHLTHAKISMKIQASVWKSFLTVWKR